MAKRQRISLSSLIQISVVATMALCVLAACSSKNCHERHPGGMPAASVAESQIRGEVVWVYKSDESKQCEPPESGTSLEKMSHDLEPIPVLRSEKKRETLVRAQDCGSASGVANAYLISRSDLEPARKKGFKEWIYN